jgi:flagellar biogenesis protein FliO
MHYFDFEKLEHKGELLEVFLLVAFVYILIFLVSWVYKRFST